MALEVVRIAVCVEDGVARRIVAKTYWLRTRRNAAKFAHRASIGMLPTPPTTPPHNPLSSCSSWYPAVCDADKPLVGRGDPEAATRSGPDSTNNALIFVRVVATTPAVADQLFEYERSSKAFLTM